MRLLRNITETLRQQPPPAVEPVRPSRTAPPGRGRPRPVRREGIQPPTEFGINTFSKLVIAHDRAPNARRVADGYVHLSSLMEFCPRMHQLCADLNIEVTERLTGAHKVIWAMGRAAEHHWRSTYIAAVNGQQVYGRWRCACGHLDSAGWLEATPPICSKCGTRAQHYHELPMYDHDAGIVGNADFVVFLQSLGVIVEIKSINKTDFDKLEHPQENHVFQATGYRRLWMRNGFAMHRNVVIVYICKDFFWGDPYREFVVDAEVMHRETALDLAWEDARNLKQARDAGEAAAKKCRRATEKRAIKCAALVPCWG